ncbi:aminotransferase [Aureococcus anophagefferens]|nr:aminotransferase [Aureococcus anophagefferens]
MPDPVPAAGVAAAARCMESGRLFRRGAAYNVASKEESEVSQVEDEFAAFTGHNFALGLNSCGSAIFLMLKCAGAEHGDKVLTNGFTFTAVPSAIVHAGCEPVYVETTPGYVVDVPDLIKKMRTGRQSYKMLNSGEGGFLVCDDDFKFAKAMAYAGAYEVLAKKHERCPSQAALDVAMDGSIPNFSLRMHEATAAMLRPQILTIEKRRAVYNERYYRIAARSALPACPSSQRDEVTIVGDSVQFNVEAAVFGDDLEAGANAFIAQCEARGLPPDCGLPATADIISRAFDVRLPLLFEEEDFDVMIEIVSECLDNVRNGVFVVDEAPVAFAR